MTSAATVANETIRVLTFINNSVQPESHGAQEDVLAALYNLHKLSPSHTIITCPVARRNYFYMSENCLSVFGYEASYMAEHFKEMKAYFSQVHAADLADLKECIDFYYSFLKNELASDYLKFRVVFHYRFRNAESNYKYLRDEKATLMTPDKFVLHFSIIHSMPEETIFSGVKMEVFKEEKLLTKILDYKPGDAKNKLSNREKDVVRLIKQGLTTKEIASQLSLSHNTIRNIKSNMFAKFNVNNIIELLNMAN